MKRREFIGGALAITAATRASAEERIKAFRVAIVHPVVPAAGIKKLRELQPFLEELRHLGYVEGQNLAIETYSGEGRRERYAEVARAVADDKPGAIVVLGVSMAREVKAVTTTIPILAAITDPIGFGLVDNLRRPGGNLTGVSLDTGPEIWSKRLELLREVGQNTSKIGVLTSPVAWERSYGPTLREAARQLGLAEGKEVIVIIKESATIIMESPQLELASLEHFPMQISLNNAFLTLIIFDGKANKLNYGFQGWGKRIRQFLRVFVMFHVRFARSTE